MGSRAVHADCRPDRPGTIVIAAGTDVQGAWCVVSSRGGLPLGVPGTTTPPPHPRFLQHLRHFDDLRARVAELGGILHFTGTVDRATALVTCMLPVAPSG